MLVCSINITSVLLVYQYILVEKKIENWKGFSALNFSSGLERKILVVSFWFDSLCLTKYDWFGVFEVCNIGGTWIIISLVTSCVLLTNSLPNVLHFSCWMDITEPFIWSFAGPVAFIIPVSWSTNTFSHLMNLTVFLCDVPAHCLCALFLVNTA